MTKWFLAMLVCMPMTWASADNDRVPPVPPVPPAPTATAVPAVPATPPVPNHNEDVVIVEIEDDDRHEVIVHRIERDSENWGNDLGDTISELVNGFGDWIGEVGQSVGRSFQFSDGGEYDLAKSDGGNATSIQEIRPAQSGGTVEIDNIVGSVVVEGWGREEIEITGRLGEEVERLQFDVDGKNTRIRAIVPKGRNRKIRTELNIRVPEHSAIEIKTVSAPIEVTAVRGSRHEIETVSGPIRIEKTSGALELKSVSGGVFVEHADDEVEVSSVSGGIEISGKPTTVEASSVSGRIVLNGVQRRASAETISGRVVIEAAELSRLNMESISGSLNYSGNLSHDAEVEASSLSGSVKIELGREVEGRYNLQSRSGTSKIDFGQRTYGPGKRLQVMHGEGDADIRIETFSGSIRISD